MDGILKYWNNGEPTLPDNSANIKALKYWLNGEAFVITYKTSAPATNTTNFFMMFE
jgi:hypothetical protein